MEFIIHFQINIFALMILLVLYVYVCLSKIKTYSRSLVKSIIIASSIGILIEPLTWIFDGKRYIGAFALEYSTNFILILMAPIIGGLVLSYIDFRAFNNPNRIIKNIYYQHASILTLILLIINIFYPIYFEIDKTANKYSNGDFLSLHYVIILFIYVYMLFFIFRNIKKISIKEILIFNISFIVPLFGVFIQFFETKIHFAWTSIAIGILIVYIFLETTLKEEDFLTKLYNRESYEKHLEYMKQNDKPFGILIFDLNDFKDINDKYGHQKGDEVLIIFAKIIKRVFKENGLVARLGGDEFAVIVHGKMKNIEELIDKVSKELLREDEKVIRKLRFGYGFEKYSKTMTIDELYVAADKKMYLNKKEAKKRQK